jgi:hypothetical protein
MECSFWRRKRAFEALKRSFETLKNLLSRFFQDLSGGRGQGGAAQPLGQSSRVLAAQDLRSLRFA